MIRKGLFCMFLLLAQGAVLQAQSLDEGCDVLGNVVQRSIAGVATHAQPPRARSEFGFYRCSATAATVTRAFTESMRLLQIKVLWESPGIPPGDVCLSHDLRQCYPGGGLFTDPDFPSDYQFMRETWNAIQSSLKLTIQREHAPDVSSFQAGTLEQTVRYQLGTLTARAELHDDH